MRPPFQGRDRPKTKTRAGARVWISKSLSGKGDSRPCSADLLEGLANAFLHRLDRFGRDLLGKRRKFPGLLGERLDLPARMCGRNLDHVREGSGAQQFSTVIEVGPTSPRTILEAVYVLSLSRVTTRAKPESSGRMWGFSSSRRISTNVTEQRPASCLAN